ncbi:MAG: hypothetical protein KZQ99_04470 [Candidatus Thiodiazotropha sp. (ex Dulcina madagascariensis)]|nr:hypothetical protein [Candidatus Thiodiazotropha sp. (ex Dulcina madagascariensis)]
MTAAQAAKLVKREVPEIKGGKPTGKTRQAPIKTDEVLAFREYDDHVVVVTHDGRKLRGDKA